MESTASQPVTAPWAARIDEERARLGQEGRALTVAARALVPLTNEKVYGDTKKLASVLARTKAKLEGPSFAAGRAMVLIQELEQWLAETPDRTRRELGQRLRDTCAARGVDLVVQRREAPILLRIPPFAVEIDFATGKAQILFARLPVLTCRADADEILAGRAQLMAEWESRFDPVVFHEHCRKAWRAARAAEEVGDERVEILTFLPHLALQLQNERFAVEPEAKHYRGYGRARFAYDVNQLRQHRKLDQQGWRLALGVATGSTAQQKKRVVYFEDGHGEGEFKLTVYFTRSEVAP